MHAGGSRRDARSTFADFATGLLPPIEQLLTVCQVDQFLGVCTATVYKWAAERVPVELAAHGVIDRSVAKRAGTPEEVAPRARCSWGRTALSSPAATSSWMAA
jgi:hypothetical protein